MKKITPLSIINFLLIFVPWTILPLRQQKFALESPYAQIIIAIYSIFIIVAFLLSLTLYVKKKMRDKLTSIAFVVNGIYTAGVVSIIFMSIPNWI